MKGVLYLVACLLSTSALAQDAHYWTNHYGTEAQMLGGVVIGSIKDLSSTYYNPAAVALSSNPDLFMATDALEFTIINYREAAGDDLDLRSFNGRAPSSLVAFRVPFKPLDNHQLLFSILTRNTFNFNATGRRVESDISSEELLRAFFAGELLVRQSVRDDWYGLTWAYTFTPRVALGLTTYISNLTQSGRIQSVSQALTRSEEGGAIIVIDTYGYYNVRLLWKLGLSLNLEPLTLGLTVTTPTLNLFGDGSIFVNSAAINIPTDSTAGMTISSLTSDFQKGLKSHYRSPLSVGLGASYRFPRGVLHVSAEWFDDVPPFTVLKAQPFKDQSTGEVLDPTLTQELGSVFNVGLGLEHVLDKHVRLFGSISTDRSAIKPDAPGRLSLATWDIFHTTLGSALTFERLDLTLGLGYSFGSDVFQPPVGFPKADEPLDLRPSDPEEVVYRRFRIQFGFAFRL